MSNVILSMNRFMACYQLNKTNQYFCMQCVDGNHEGHTNQKYKGEHQAEGQHSVFASPASQCNCPCTDKRSKQFKLLFEKFKLNLIKYLENGNLGIISYHQKPRQTKKGKR